MLVFESPTPVCVSFIVRSPYDFDEVFKFAIHNQLIDLSRSYDIMPIAEIVSHLRSSIN